MTRGVRRAVGSPRDAAGAQQQCAHPGLGVYRRGETDASVECTLATAELYRPQWLQLRAAAQDERLQIEPPSPCVADKMFTRHLYGPAGFDLLRARLMM